MGLPASLTDDVPGRKRQPRDVKKPTSPDAYKIYSEILQKRIYPFEIKRVRRITSFSGNELATVPIAVVCIALLVQVTLRMQRYKKYSG